MLSIVATWWIKDGREADAVRALHELVAEVEQQEPFTTMYLLHTAVVEGSRPTLPGNEVVFISAWPSRAAFDRHLDGQVFSSWTAKYLDLFLTDDRGGLFVTSEFLDQQAGFVRPVTTGAQPK